MDRYGKVIVGCDIICMEFRAVKEVFEENRRIYGCRRMRQAPENRVKVMSEWRIMRENGLYPVQLKKFRPGKRAKPNGRYYENIVQQQFSPEKPNEKWAGDITYLRTKLGWAYLAAVIDLHNREAIRYSISKKIDAELAYQALSNAIARNGKPKELVFHSDRGGVSTAAGNTSRCLRTTGSEVA